MLFITETRYKEDVLYTGCQKHVQASVMASYQLTYQDNEILWDYKTGFSGEAKHSNTDSSTLHYCLLLPTSFCFCKYYQLCLVTLITQYNKYYNYLSLLSDPIFTDKHSLVLKTVTKRSQGS
jgi:hypothetical protein